jgi:exodeoxyribonuclease VII large subunit
VDQGWAEFRQHVGRREGTVALDSSPDKPVPVRVVASLIGQWIARLGRVWVEGQVTQVTRRPGARTVYLTLRDPAADISLSVTCPTIVLDRLPAPLADGASIVVFARPDFYAARGQLSLAATEIRPVGVGELLARLEQLKRTLTAEGLFSADRKRPLPFLPAVVGLVCGRASAAERDVVENARRRWPAVRFSVKEVPVQGVTAVTDVCRALAELQGEPEVDVIVLARGGGSVEDLLPFSNEALVRAVATCRVPVVSAIGHETDTPLSDLAADRRASTPTDAAKLVVPDLAEERTRVDTTRQRLRRAVELQWQRERSTLAALRSRPVLASPLTLLEARTTAVSSARGRLRSLLEHRTARSTDELAHVRARLRALSPQATLDRGYAVVHTAGGDILRRHDAAVAGERLHIRVATGPVEATVVPPVSP